MKEKIICEISGGADSFLSALYAKDKYPEAEFYGIIFNYGQKPFEKEYECAMLFCQKENIPLKVVTIGNLFDKGTVVGESEAATSGIANIYTPLRNLVFLGCASSYAESIGAERIISGSKTLSVDSGAYSFKDSTLPFYKMFEAMLTYVAYNPIKVEMILGEGRQNKMTKKDVYVQLMERGYSWESFWNCFNDIECGKCNNCVERNELKDEVTEEYMQKLFAHVKEKS
jgi:7-cyano-7-deazaguanine synthase